MVFSGLVMRFASPEDQEKFWGGFLCVHSTKTIVDDQRSVLYDMTCVFALGLPPIRWMQSLATPLVYRTSVYMTLIRIFPSVACNEMKDRSLAAKEAFQREGISTGFLAAIARSKEKLVRCSLGNTLGV